MTTELTDWEKSQIHTFAAKKVVASLSWFVKGGFWSTDQLHETNQWRTLMAKVANQPAPQNFTPEHFPKSHFYEKAKPSISGDTDQDEESI